jgi:signal transduction histidine kinase/CheY-like chemotaxis protein
VRALADYCIIDVVEENGELRRARALARDPSKQSVCDALLQMRIERSQPHFISQALETKRSVLVREVTPEVVAAWVQSAEHLRVLRELDPKSIMAVPLLARGKLLGILELVSVTSSRLYGPTDLRLAEELAYRAALAIENARLYRVAERAIHARDEVLGIVAHDLRNPLGSILMLAELLKPRTGEPERRARRPAESIERAAIRMQRLIQDLLDIARLEAGHLSIERTPFHAGAIVSECAETQERLISSKALVLRLDLAPDLGEVLADRDRLQQILENLVGNAVKFTPRGGHITVGAAPRDGEVLFWVADTGAGIEAGDLPQLFDRFWQARQASMLGAGLGLPIVKGLVEAHGGRIWVESQVGVGSTFFFTLPFAREPKTALAPTDNPVATRAWTAESRQPARIVLVAEDDPDVRGALCETLECAGYEVAMVANGAEALEYLGRESPPLLVILDLMMPVMDGWAFLAERNRDPDLRSIPVIVVSGQGDLEDRLAAAHVSYVQKPIRADRLIETMEHVVR